MDPLKHGLGSLKPGVSRSIHLFAAPLLWTCVGGILIFRGWQWINPEKYQWYIFFALVIGTAKSLAILDRSARKTVDRIVHMRDGTCLGAIYSWKTWLLVVLMISSGFLMRTFFSPGNVIGLIYVAIGWALLFSSRLGWMAWFRWIKTDK